MSHPRQQIHKISNLVLVEREISSLPFTDITKDAYVVMHGCPAELQRELYSLQQVQKLGA